MLICALLYCLFNKLSIYLYIYSFILIIREIYYLFTTSTYKLIIENYFFWLMNYWKSKGIVVIPQLDLWTCFHLGTCRFLAFVSQSDGERRSNNKSNLILWTIAPLRLFSLGNDLLETDWKWSAVKNEYCYETLLEFFVLLYSIQHLNILLVYCRTA